MPAEQSPQTVIPVDDCALPKEQAEQAVLDTLDWNAASEPGIVPTEHAVHWLSPVALVISPALQTLHTDWPCVSWKVPR